MERRKFVLGLGALAAGGAAATGSGAFSSVEADRSINVAVEEDSSGFLRLQPADKLGDNANGAYAEETGDGTVSINLDENARNVSGSGLNAEATTEIHGILAVSNDGSQEVGVSVDVSFESDLGDGEFDVLAGDAADNKKLSEELEAEWVNVGVGDTIFLGAEITTGSPAELDGTVTIRANEDEAGN